jgi:hypothetical protein
MTTLDGAQVEVELGERANVDLVGIVGPTGPMGPMGPPGSPMAGYFTPQQFGAVGDGVHDDTAAVNAAIQAAAPGGTSPALGQGGICYFPPGTYKCTGPLFYYPNQLWVGAGYGASALRLTTELWPGGAAPAAHFISAAGGPNGPGQSQGASTRISNLLIRGPGAGSSPGQTQSHTTGIQGFNGGFLLDNLSIGGGFYAGLEMVGNHNKCYSLYITGNYYGLDYSDARISTGNDAYFACNLTGNGLAGIHVGGAAVIQTAVFSQLHLGFGPVGIFKTDNQNGWDASGNPVYTGGTASTQDLFQMTSLEDVSFESIGNGAILDISTGANRLSLGYGTVLRGNGLLWNNASATTKAPLDGTDSKSAWAMVLRNNDSGSRIETGVYPFITAPTTGVGVLKIPVAGAVPPAFRFGGNGLPPANFFGSGTNWSANIGGRGKMLALGQFSGTQYMGDLYPMACATATTVINVGDVVELASNSSVQRASGTKPAFGIALTPSPGNAGAQVPLLVQTTGFCTVNSTVAAPAIGSPLYLDATTTYMVNNTNTSGRVVGQSVFTSGTTTIPAQLAFKVA